MCAHEMRKDFFISYSSSDTNWATWIAEILESVGYTTIIQAWDFKPGGSFINDMHEAIVQCERLILVLSDKYFKSDYCKAEWQNIFVNDSIGSKEVIIPVRVDDAKPQGLLSARTYIDLFGIDEEEARKVLLEGVKSSQKVRKSGGFPGKKVMETFEEKLTQNNLADSKIDFTESELIGVHRENVVSVKGQSSEIDYTLKQRLDRLAKKQLITSQEILAHEADPNGMSDICKLAQKIFNEVTDRSLFHKKDITGSWIAGQFMPFQLITQQHLMIDITETELNRIKPFNIPIQSLIDLARNNFIYINIRDYSFEKDNDSLCKGTSAYNLNRLLDAVENKIYFGCALRKPLFDLLIKAQGYSWTYEKYQNDFFQELGQCAEAYKKIGITTENTLFRGETPSLIAAANHYAFLKATCPNLSNNIFAGENNVDDQLGSAYYCGEKWKNNKSDPDLAEKAAKKFEQITTILRSYHVFYTAPITGSWGCTYNRKQKEYIGAVAEASFNKENTLKNNSELQIFLNDLLTEKKIINIQNKAQDLTHMDPCFNYNNMPTNENLINRLMESLYNYSHIYTQLQEVLREIENDYGNANLSNPHSPDWKRIKSLYDNYNVKTKERTKGILKYLNPVLSIEAVYKLPLSPVQLKIAANAKDIPKIVKQLLVPDIDLRTAMRFHEILD